MYRSNSDHKVLPLVCFFFSIKVLKRFLCAASQCPSNYVIVKFIWKNISLLQCYSVLSDILVKNKLCIPFERGSNILSTGKDFICLPPPVSLKSLRFSVLSTKGHLRSVL